MAPSVRDIAGYVGAELIGSGGFGAVYRATDAAHGRDVAIKVLQGSLGEAERRRFDRERQTMGRLGAHPYIIPVYESGYTEAGEGFIVMELATGGSLRDRLKTAPLPWHEATKVMAAVADAIQAAHDNGVLHRDIKPDNILIDQFNNPKLSDFGIAAVASNQTATTSTTATLAHAAPELLEGKTSTPSIDIYALGSTLHNLITGRAPFVRTDDNNAAAMIARVINESPPDLRPHGVPESVVRIIERALSKNPDDRQSTAAQLAAELRSVETGDSASTEQLPPNANETQIAAAPMPDGPNSGRINTPTSQTNNPLGLGQPSGAPSPGQVPTGANPAPNPPGLGYAAPDQRPAPPPGYGPPPANQAPPASLPTPPPGYGNVPNQGAAGQTVVSGPGTGNISAPYSTGQSWDPPREVVSKNGGGGGRWWLVAVAAVVLLAGGGLIALLAGGDDDPVIGAGDPTETTPTTISTTASTGTTTADSTADSTATTPSSSALATGDQPTVEVDCPDEIALNTNIVCSIFTTNATSGEWHLPAFLAAPEPIEVVPGEYEIFIEPTNPEAIDRTFTISATVEDADGQTARVNHSFRVVGVLVEIDCPETIALNSSVVCDIVSTNATEGDWDIPGFGSAPLEVVPGSNPIFIEPNDAGSVGRTYTITATVSDASGETHTATRDFTVGPAGS